MPTYLLVYSLLNTKLIKADHRDEALSKLQNMTDSELAEDSNLRIDDITLEED